MRLIGSGMCEMVICLWITMGAHSTYVHPYKISGLSWSPLNQFTVMYLYMGNSLSHVNICTETLHMYTFLMQHTKIHTVFCVRPPFIHLGVRIHLVTPNGRDNILHQLMSQLKIITHNFPFTHYIYIFLTLNTHFLHKMYIHIQSLCFL